MTKRKKILLIGPVPHSAGGISTVVKTLLSSDFVERYEVYHLRPNIKYPKKLGTNNDLSKAFKLLLLTVSLTRHFLICLFKPPDLVLVLSSHYGDFWRNSLFMATSKLFGRKLCLWIHGSKFDQFCLQSTKIRLIIIKRILSMPDIVFVLSRSWLRFLLNYVPEHKVKILFNPIISVNFNSNEIVNGKFEDLRDSNVILFVGNADARDLKRKGVYDILDAVPLLRSNHSDFLFVFAGPENDANLRSICKKKEIESNALFLGSVPSDKLKGLYSLAKIFILPSYAEGLPIAILEAMASGLPVISTPVGGIPELVEDGINGFLVRAGDVEAIAEKTSLLLSDSELRRDMGQYNIEKVRQKFDVEVIVNQLEKHFNSVLING